MHSWGMWGPWMLIPVLVVCVMLGAMRHHWWSAGWTHRHERRHRRDAMEREDLRLRQDRDQVEELERRVAELESGLDFAERILANRGESRGLPRRSTL